MLTSSLVTSATARHDHISGRFGYLQISPELIPYLLEHGRDSAEGFRNVCFKGFNTKEMPPVRAKVHDRYLGQILGHEVCFVKRPMYQKPEGAERGLVGEILKERDTARERERESE